MRSRAFKALGVVALGVLAVPLIQGGLNVSSDLGMASSLSAINPSSQEDTLSQIEEMAREGVVESTDKRSSQVVSFEEEAFSLQGVTDLRVGGGGSVIGFSKKGTGKAAFDDITRLLEGAGWTKVPSGQDSQGSFAKTDGSLRWLYVSCTEVVDQVSVVIQLSGERKEEG